MKTIWPPNRAVPHVLRIQALFEESDEIADTERGEGGFGSTGA